MAKRPWETILEDDEDDLEAEHIISEIKNFRNEKFFNVYFNQIDFIEKKLDDEKRYEGFRKRDREMDD